jgi:hypothetical protein
MTVAASLGLYPLARFLYRSNRRTLPRAQSSVFKMLPVGLVALIAMLSLAGLDPLRTFSLVEEDVLSIIEGAGYVA